LAEGVDVVDKTIRQRPVVGKDTEYFWSGLLAGELRIQRCVQCAALRHPASPVCDECLSLEWDWVVAAGWGRVHSFVVHRHPPSPGFELPITLVLVDLVEGVRMVGQLLEQAGTEVTIGDQVALVFETIDEELVLAQWRLPRPGEGPDPGAPVEPRTQI
jgi:uncharacterized OB-fold protein